MDRLSTVFQRLKHRKVVQWTIAYLSAAWLILQVVDVVGEQFGWPGALERGITVALGFGLLTAVVVAWYHGEKGHQRVTRTETLLLTAVFLLAAGTLVGTVRGSGPDSSAPGPADRGATIPMDAAAVAVVPFAPTSPDSALERLGRDLAVTLAATLDGIDGIRTVDGLTLLAHTPVSGPALSLPQAQELASRLGAGRLLRGALTRVATGVRVDAALHEGGGRPVARASVSLRETDDLGAVIDSLTLELLRRLWSRPTAELPSTAALGTRSAEALRAYVEGEEALARGEMVAAVSAFERAVAQDSTYWFAYWRSLYPRVYEGSPADPAVLAQVYEHRDKLPPADRMLVEAQVTETVSDRLEILRQATRRFPTHWPAWYTLANVFVHHSAPLGTSYPDARAALERVVALNPEFGGAWDHLFWMVVHQRDTAATRRVMDRMREFVDPGGFQYNEDFEAYFGATATAVAGGDHFDPETLAEIAAYVHGYSGPLPAAAFGIGLLIMGLPHATVQLADAVLERSPGAALTASMWRGKAYAWAGRGAWDSAGVAVDRWVRADGSPAERLGGYGLLATGAALGGLAPEDAVRRRPHDVPPDAPANARAELAWLDGVLGFARDDGAGLIDARQRVAQSGGEFAPLLIASLDALTLRRDGRREAAIAMLLAAEDSSADRYGPNRIRHIHPYVPTVNRVLLGRWLLEAGRPTEAARLLSWNEAVLPGAPLLEVVNRTVGLLGTYERARAEESMGRIEEARTHYRRFIDAYDHPAEPLRPLVENARARLHALTPRVRG